jgi:hypothetical protein
MRILLIILIIELGCHSEELEMNNKNVMSSSYFYPSSENATQQSKTAASLKFYLQQLKEWSHQESLDKIVKKSRCRLL